MKIPSLSDIQKLGESEITKKSVELKKYTSKLKADLRSGFSKDLKSYRLAKKSIARMQTQLQNLNS